MVEANLGLAALLSDVESDCRPLPLPFVFNKIQFSVQNKPNDFFAGNEILLPSVCCSGGVCDDK
jgi:hypothetical protein